MSLAADPFVINHRADDPVSWIRAAAHEKLFSTEMMAARLGTLALVGLPGELACSLGRHIKQHSPFAHTCPVGLVNDQVGYLITEASRRLGGYEADTSLCALTAEGSAEKIVETAIDLLRAIELRR
jgi:hypothetical protein